MWFVALLGLFFVVFGFAGAKIFLFLGALFFIGVFIYLIFDHDKTKNRKRDPNRGDKDYNRIPQNDRGGGRNSMTDEDKANRYLD